VKHLEISDLTIACSRDNICDRLSGPQMESTKQNNVLSIMALERTEKCLRVASIRDTAIVVGA
jgi:hypothetical protein